MSACPRCKAAEAERDAALAQKDRLIDSLMKMHAAADQASAAIDLAVFTAGRGQTDTAMRILHGFAGAAA